MLLVSSNTFQGCLLHVTLYQQQGHLFRFYFVGLALSSTFFNFWIFIRKKSILCTRLFTEIDFK